MSATSIPVARLLQLEMPIAWQEAVEVARAADAAAHASGSQILLDECVISTDGTVHLVVTPGKRHGAPYTVLGLLSALLKGQPAPPELKALMAGGADALSDFPAEHGAEPAPAFDLNWFASPLPQLEISRLAARAIEAAAQQEAKPIAPRPRTEIAPIAPALPVPPPQPMRPPVDLRAFLRPVAIAAAVALVAGGGLIARSVFTRTTAQAAAVPESPAPASSSETAVVESIVPAPPNAPADTAPSAAAMSAGSDKAPRGAIRASAASPTPSTAIAATATSPRTAATAPTASAAPPGPTMTSGTVTSAPMASTAPAAPLVAGPARPAGSAAAPPEMAAITSPAPPAVTAPPPSAIASSPVPAPPAASEPEPAPRAPSPAPEAASRGSDVIEVPPFRTPPASVTASGVRLYSLQDEDVEPPVFLRPQLPAEFKPDSEQSASYIEVTVDERGQVAQVRLRSSDASLNDRMIVAAAKAWQFRPAVKDGRPVPYVLTVPVTR
jgi:hypothetical protein